MRCRIPDTVESRKPIAARFGNCRISGQPDAFDQTPSAENLDAVAESWNEILARDAFAVTREWHSAMDAATSARGGGWQVAQLFSLYQKTLAH